MPTPFRCGSMSIFLIGLSKKIIFDIFVPMIEGSTVSQNKKPVKVRIETQGEFASLFIDSEISGSKKVTEVSMRKEGLSRSVDLVIASVVEMEEYEVAALLKNLKEKYQKEHENERGVCIESPKRLENRI